MVFLVFWVRLSRCCAWFFYALLAGAENPLDTLGPGSLFDFCGSKREKSKSSPLHRVGWAYNYLKPQLCQKFPIFLSMFMGLKQKLLQVAASKQPPDPTSWSGPKAH